MNIANAAFEGACGLGSQLLAPDLPEVAFSGRSNVGKSSLINKILCRRSLARVSSTPGKTATVNFYRVDTVRLVDLPGYGYAKVSKAEKQRWGELINGYFDGERPLKLVLQLVDMRHPLSADDKMMLEYLRAKSLPFAVVMTKADKLNKTERAARMAAFPEELKRYGNVKLIAFSAETGEGAPEICAEIEQAMAR